MYYCDRSLQRPEENLAWDEALVECSESHPSDEVLRVWEMPRPCVVMGRSSRVAWEVELERCREDDVPVLRRMSGGASIVAGPGCLMYSVLLSLDARPECRMLDHAHRTVMEHTRIAVAEAMRHCGLPGALAIEGICDLTWNGLKISGNALRVKRRWLLYHGTLLVAMPVGWISRYLKQPPRQPEYRADRPHDQFVSTLVSDAEVGKSFMRQLRMALRGTWNAERPWSAHPLAAMVDDDIPRWMERRYGDPAWHLGVREERPS